MGKLRSLELGRFIAASLVVVAHTLQFINSRTATPGVQLFGGVDAPGALGVQYFFVLSGFVMMSAHHRDFGRLGSAPKFWWRRICRIYPVYWLALMVPVYYLAGLMTPLMTFQLFSLEPQTVSDFIAPAWTLRYEMAFYITFGLCLLPYVGKPLLVLWVLIVVALWGPSRHMTLFLIGLPGPTIGLAMAKGHFLAFFELYFFAGLAGGWLFVTYRPAIRYGAGVMAAGVLLLLVCMPLINWGRTYGSPNTVFIMSVVLGLCILGLAWLEGRGAFQLGRWASFLGAMSYPLYILHTPLVLVADKMIPVKLGAVGLYAYLGVMFVVTYGVTAVVTVLFDQPLQRFLRRISITLTPKPVAIGR